MKRYYTLLMGAALALNLAGTSVANPVFSANEDEAIKALEASAVRALSESQWDQFSDNLVDALKTSHPGLQQAAMRLVINYSDDLNVEEAVFDVMRIYRDHPDENFRRMAVVTLGSMQSDWAIKFLERSVRFEKSETVRSTIRAVVSEYNGA